MGGGGSNEITMNPDEMHTIICLTSLNIEISFQNNLAPKLKSFIQRNIMRVEKPQKQLLC